MSLDFPTIARRSAVWKSLLEITLFPLRRRVQGLRMCPLLRLPRTHRRVRRASQRPLKLFLTAPAAFNVTTRERLGWLPTINTAIAGTSSPTAAPIRARTIPSGPEKSSASSHALTRVTPIQATCAAHLPRLRLECQRRNRQRKVNALPTQVIVGQKSLVLTARLAVRPGDIVDTEKRGVANAAKVETASIATTVFGTYAGLRSLPII